MITGAWISPTRTRLAVQFNEDDIVVVDARYEQLLELDEAGMSGVPSHWEPLYEPEP